MAKGTDLMAVFGAPAKGGKAPPESGDDMGAEEATEDYAEPDDELAAAALGTDDPERIAALKEYVRACCEGMMK